MQRDLFTILSHRDQWQVVNDSTQETVVISDSHTKCSLACAALNANPGIVFAPDDLRAIMSCAFEV